MTSPETALQTSTTPFSLPPKEEILADYRLGWESRHAALIGRKEVLTGKAKFGIFGDGKEVAQLAMARVFQPGDFRSGYYRDQTFMFAAGMATIKQFYAQLYADTERDPMTRGRQMNSHFSSHLLDENGAWRRLTELKNTTADISPTAGQMARMVGIAYASKLYRQLPELEGMEQFSVNGNEVSFGTIGNASCAEGIFWEAVNAAGVLRIPLAISIWDDDYGISVPNEYQITKQDLSQLLSGFHFDEEKQQGFYLYRLKGWDYEALLHGYSEGIALCREHHIPVIFHIDEMTQPQGHSTSGSHERYKSKERLEWEKEFDCLRQMRLWMVRQELCTEEEADQIEDEAKKEARRLQKEAWKEVTDPVRAEKKTLAKWARQLKEDASEAEGYQQVLEKLESTFDLDRRTVGTSAFELLRLSRHQEHPARQELASWYERFIAENRRRYSSHLFSESEENALRVDAVAPVYSENSPHKDGREVLLAFFDEALARDPRLFVIGEDVGHIGDVNQGLAGMQAKYGALRVTDTGIREATILGQGIGAAMRGLRPIIEIQYLDYLMYALQTASDDLASLQYRSAGTQKAPVIIRTRGHRLEGIWHSGSLMGAYLNALRGLHVCVPRNMTRAAGMYNTLLQSDEPALVVERLNAYRIKERLPENVADIRTPLGVPETLREGEDLTIVTYGACTDICLQAAEKLQELEVSCEVIDVQTLLPFDRHHAIAGSLRKTNRVLFVDEDVPGGATAFMMQKVLDEQKGYYYLDSEPQCLTAQEHRPPYGNDGDYFAKPNVEQVIARVYEIMNEADPRRFPIFW
jgi:pyruvate/2-oxoglutarate/acetoin dehydrogenase E1 component/TPP-dependent pyruvate/acetoin dehydrogenase alpha subunit